MRSPLLLGLLALLPGPDASRAPAPHHARVLDATQTACPPARTFCHSVTIVGDSTGVGAVRDPGPASLPAQLRAVGVEEIDVHVASGRGAISGPVGVPGAQKLAREKLAYGYAGCWIMAVGMNDAASEERDQTGIAERIETVMRELRGAPVLWVTVRTVRESGGYSMTNMQAWNDGLFAASAYHDNLAVYDWASESRPEHYSADRVHFIPSGDRARSAGIARALARSFSAK